MGSGEEGVIGNGKLEHVHTPCQLRSLEGIGINVVECGAFHTLALTTDGKLYIWGRGDGGQLGLPFKLIRKRLKDAQMEPDWILLKPEPVIPPAPDSVEGDYVFT
jgi:alpha-tubulin suppressor-like RCC1 family protein